MTPPLGKTQQRLMSKMRLEDHGYTSLCWIWTGATDQKGYGRISVGNINERVHIISAKLFLSDYERHLQTCHKCDVKRCFNPEHLFMGTNSDNQKDRYRKHLKTHCKNGHEFTPENTRMQGGKVPQRVCLTCKKRSLLY